MFWDDKEKNVIAAGEYGFDARQYLDFEDFNEQISRFISQKGGS